MKIYSVKHFWRMCKLPSVACKNFRKLQDHIHTVKKHQPTCGHIGTTVNEAEFLPESNARESGQILGFSGHFSPGHANRPRTILEPFFAQVRIINLNRTCITEIIWKIRRNGWQVGSIILFLNSRLKRRLIWSSTRA